MLYLDAVLASRRAFPVLILTAINRLVMGSNERTKAHRSLCLRQYSHALLALTRFAGLAVSLDVDEGLARGMLSVGITQSSLSNELARKLGLL